MSGTVVGVDIGSASIRAVEVRLKQHGLGKHGTFEICSLEVSLV